VCPTSRPTFKPQAETPSKMQPQSGGTQISASQFSWASTTVKFHVGSSIQIVDKWAVNSRHNDDCFSTRASTFLHPANPLLSQCLVPMPSYPSPAHPTAHSPINVVPARITPRPQPADPRVKRLLSLSQLPSLEHRPLTDCKKKASLTQPVTLPRSQTKHMHDSYSSTALYFVYEWI
jgi:hypothetical protein